MLAKLTRVQQTGIKPRRPARSRVYEYESKSGDRNRPDVDRWTTEETITGRVSIPEGLVVLRSGKQLPNA